jgi:hypothetical protein
MAASLDMLPDTMIDKVIEDKIKEEDGKIMFPLDLFTAGEPKNSSEFLELIDAAKAEITDNTLGEDEQQPKLQSLAKGFMFQAGKAMAGNEPFYTEVHLIGENQYAVSGNKNGVLTRSDIKALRKSLKALMNQEKEEYNVEKAPATQMDDGMNELYYDDGEGPDY